MAAIGTQPYSRGGTAQLRTEGYLRALDRAGLLHDQDFQRSVHALHRANGARAMNELLDGPTAPDAVFAFSDELVLGALHTAHQRGLRGLRVPEDIAIVGFDDIEDGRCSNPPLPPVSPDKQQIAERSLQCLADRIYSHSPANATPPQEVTVPHRLVARSTT
ncbi:substrate-binding domain-containing protein [Streptomyces sp. NPDC005951]|uniref:substrate-binding domain-containing protein n=1 Tax=Streptomyces sp. NPDC005951 TaxID=3154573 RepID=UPI0033CB61A0